MFEFTQTCIGSGKYVCPPDAGPAWRAAFEAGCDMEELEANLRLTPEERIAKHDKLLQERFEFDTFMEKLYRGWLFARMKNQKSEI
jgi:hypothetical protein